MGAIGELMSTLRTIIRRAQTESDANADEGKLLLWAEDGYRLFMHDGNGIASAQWAQPLTVGQALYPLPADWLIPDIGSACLLTSTGAKQLLRFRSPWDMSFCTELGVPKAFGFPSPQLFALDPCPGNIVAGYSFVIDYTQEVTSVTPLPPDNDLLLPAYVELGLRAYVLAKLAGQPGEGAPEYQSALRRWKGARVDRMALGQTRRASGW